MVEAGSYVDDVVSDAIGDADIPQNISEAAAQLEDAVVEAGSYVDDVVSENLPEFDIPEVNLPSLDLAMFAGLLKSRPGGEYDGILFADDEQAALDEQGYAFAEGLRPLGQIDPVKVPSLFANA